MIAKTDPRQSSNHGSWHVNIQTRTGRGAVAGTLYRLATVSMLVSLLIPPLALKLQRVMKRNA